MKASRIVLAAIVVLSIVVFFALDLARFFDVGYLKSHQAALDEYFHLHPITTVLLYFILYVVVTGTSLPGATILTLAGGALFGLFWGTVIVSFASSVGASAAFLASRFLFRDWVQRRFGAVLQSVNDGVRREGAFYLFTLRLLPIFPFFAVNLLMGLVPMRLRTFYGISQLGMLAGTIV